MSQDFTEPRCIRPLRQPRIKGFRWVSPQDELDERIYREILSRGCSILSFGASATSPQFTYSAGLYLNFLHPEVLLMGLHPDTAHAVITRIRDSAASGHMLTSDTVRHDLFTDGRPVRFRVVPQERYPDYLGRNCNLYFSLFGRGASMHDFGYPVLQGIWPDSAGRFPWDPDCNSVLAGIHTLVAQP